METLNNESHSPQPDLKVTLQHSSLVFPSQQTATKSIFLSNFDQVLNFNVKTVHFFPAHPEFSPPAVAEKLKAALSKVLVPYDFLAGRLKRNQDTDRLEIDCNRAGVGFVVASSEYSLDEIGDLVYPNPAFRQLIVQSLDNLEPHDLPPLCIFQLTSFKCGGFAMGTSINHATGDGLSSKKFLENLASQAADKPLAITLCNNRHLLAARSPPQVTFSHPDLVKLNIQIGEDQIPPILTSSNEDLDIKIFRLSSKDVSFLKEKATVGITSPTKAKITGFNVVATHIWRCKALSLNAGCDLDRLSTIIYSIDIRQRLHPPLPQSYTGNGVAIAYATTRCKELEEGPLWRLVEMVSEGATRMTDEYIRSKIDWLELHKGFIHGEFVLSSWWRLGLSQVDYPWGRPRYSCPVVSSRKDTILLIPDIIDADGVSVLVALPSEEMKVFESLFHKFLTGA